MTTTALRPPPAVRVSGWGSVAALAVGGFAIGTTEFATMGVLPLITDDLGTTVPRGGQLVSAYALGVVVGAPLLAVLAARFPRRAVLLVLMAAFTAGNALSAVAPSFGLLVLARFASGLPHGAYFGIAALVAASLVPPQARGRAVARVMLGLTVANVAGVPLATVLGQQLGWRSTYWAVAVLGVLTVLAVARWVPDVPAVPGAGARTELGALRNRQVWLTLAVGAVGGGGFFAVYSYISPTLQQGSGVSEAGVPVALALFGLGMTLGTEVAGRLVDRSVLGTLVVGTLLNTAALVGYAFALGSPVPAVLGLFVLGLTSATAFPALQARLMDVAGDAQALAATGNHASFNVANAQGAAVGGAVLAAGLGWSAPALAGAVLALAGLGLLAVSVRLERR